MGSLTLHCLGTGDGWPGADRAHSAFLYQSDQATVLIDFGEPVGHSLKAGGWGPDAIDGAFLSHLHFDHVGGFFMLIQGFWLEGRRRPLAIHLPAEGIAPIQAMLDAGYVFHDLLPFGLGFKALRAKASVKYADLRVTPHPSTHLATLRSSFQPKYPQAFESFSFLLESNGLRVVHSADLGAIDDLSPLLKKPVDLLVCELAHFEIEAAAAFLSQFPIRRILFVHLAGSLRADPDRTRTRLKRGLGTIPWAIAEDGTRVIVRTPRRPSSP